MDWLKEGDRNTAFFQAKSRARAWSNKIVSLKRDDASLAVSQEDLESTTATFYTELFIAQGDLEPRLILEHVPCKVTARMNEKLGRPFSADEVEKALFIMGPSKALGPDGLTAGFF